MLLNFYIQGSPAETLPTEDEKDNHWASYVDSLASLTLEDIKEKASPIIDSARSTFKYLRGDTVPSMTPPATTNKENSRGQERTEEQSWWGLTGLFSGLRGRRSYDEGSHGVGSTWTEGEVHADLVRVRQTISQVIARLWSVVRVQECHMSTRRALRSVHHPFPLVYAW